jgi:hypothetical protein
MVPVDRLVCLWALIVLNGMYILGFDFPLRNLRRLRYERQNVRRRRSHMLSHTLGASSEPTHSAKHHFVKFMAICDPPMSQWENRSSCQGNFVKTYQPCRRSHREECDLRALEVEIQVSTPTTSFFYLLRHQRWISKGM